MGREFKGSERGAGGIRREGQQYVDNSKYTWQCRGITDGIELALY